MKQKQENFVKKLAELMSEFDIKEMQAIYTIDNDLGINCLVKDDSELKEFFIEMTNEIAKNFAAEFAGGVELMRKREEVKIASRKTRMN